MRFNGEPCAWCGGDTEPATGVYLALIARGQVMCRRCGRFTLHCECPISPKIQARIDERIAAGGSRFPAYRLRELGIIR